MRFAIFQDSQIGGRTINQDRLAYSYTREALLMVVADGMGGHIQGEVAAEIAVRVTLARFEREAAPTVRQPAEFLPDALFAAHRAIGQYAGERRLADSPRTTYVCCLVQGGNLWVIHAGDSRFYLLRNGKLIARTRDHSRVQYLVDAGIISEKLAETHPERNKVYSCLGGAETPQYDLAAAIALRQGDTALLATDGFWSTVRVEEIIATLAGRSILEAMPELMRSAGARGGAAADNLSVIAMSWDGRGGELSSGISTVTLPLSGVTTQMGGARDDRRGAADVSDEEIDQAIAEIQSAIKRLSGD